MCQAEQKSHWYTVSSLPDSRRRSSAAVGRGMLGRVRGLRSTVGPPVRPDTEGAVAGLGMTSSAPTGAAWSHPKIVARRAPRMATTSRIHRAKRGRRGPVGGR